MGDNFKNTFFKNLSNLVLFRCGILGWLGIRIIVSEYIKFVRHYLGLLIWVFSGLFAITFNWYRVCQGC